MEKKLLSIFLNDQLVVATVGVELAKRTRRSNRDGELGSLLAEVVGDLEGNRAALEDLLVRLDVSRDSLKQAVGWTGEKLGRLKLNGRIRDYSPLSRLTELEGLTLVYTLNGVRWRGLDAALGRDARVGDFDLAGRAERCERYRAALEAQARVSAAAAL